MARGRLRAKRPPRWHARGGSASDPAMRIAFMGTPDFAVPTLDRLVADGHDVAAVYTQPPRRAGRGKSVTPSPVQRRAEALGLSVRSPATLRDQADRDAFRELDLDVAVVAAYGLILPQPILDAPRSGCLNVHASLLPRWRGAAPIQRAILAGDAETGVTIMRMERGLDTGPMLLVRRTPIGRKTAGELTAELAALGAAAIAEALRKLSALAPEPQPDTGVTYAPKIDKAEAKLDFSQDAEGVERQVRAFAPSPGAFFEHVGERIRILSAVVASEVGNVGNVLSDDLLIGCEQGSIRPTHVQRAGRGIMTTADLLRGFPLPTGTVIG